MDGDKIFSELLTIFSTYELPWEKKRFGSLVTGLWYNWPKKRWCWKKFLKNPEFITSTHKVGKRMSLPADVTTMPRTHLRW